MRTAIFRPLPILVAISASAMVLALAYPAAPAAAFGMGGGAPSVGVGVGSMSAGSTMTSNGANASYAHGSPAATNPAVAAMEARQRDTQVAAEIDQARKAGRGVTAAETERRKGEGAIEANHAEEAMLHFDHAEQDIGILSNTTAMGAYSKSGLGSMTAGGTELSGAIVH